MSEKIKELGELASIVQRAKEAGKRVVFTNGCFDMLHCGHLYLLREAKKLGDLLIVAMNGDESVHGIKGTARPIFPEGERAELLAALEVVDFVTVFSEPDPLHVIQELKPDVLVKGGDWSKDEIIGGDAVEGTGGTVAVIPTLPGYSTTNIIEKIRQEISWQKSVPSAAKDNP